MSQVLSSQSTQTKPDERSSSAAVARKAEFRLPGASDRTIILGATGTGKTTFGAWVLSRQRFNERAWVLMDFKNEELWRDIPKPYMQDLSLSSLPGKRGLYRLPIRPGQEDELEAWMWRIWERENVGLFCDEVSLIPQRAAFKACLRQGRSKRIPVIACSQRPVDVDREVFTESTFVSVFRLDDYRDYKVVQMFTRNAPVDVPLPDRHSYWYDKQKISLLTLKPVPKPDIIVRSLKADVPQQRSIFGF